MRKREQENLCGICGHYHNYQQNHHPSMKDFAREKEKSIDELKSRLENRSVGSVHWMGKVNFVEIRSFWHIFRSFDIMWIFLILSLQAMIIIAWNGGTPSDIFDVGVLKQVCTSRKFCLQSGQNGENAKDVKEIQLLVVSKEQVYPRLLLVAACHKRLGPVYASSRKENYECVNDPFSMESLKKAMGGAKKQWAIQERLIDQISKLRGQGSDGNGGNKNHYGGSGGGSDGNYRFYTHSNFCFMFCCLFFYIHIIRGEELYRLARDYIRYLVTGKRTFQLKRAMLNWHNFSEGITKKDSTQEDTFERSVASEPMWWQQPLKFVHPIEELCRGYLRPHAQES
ncbi:hypothetical protein ABZP36_003745 [Zizania latifolia]